MRPAGDVSETSRGIPSPPRRAPPRPALVRHAKLRTAQGNFLIRFATTRLPTPATCENRFRISEIYGTRLEDKRWTSGGIYSIVVAW